MKTVMTLKFLVIYMLLFLLFLISGVGAAFVALSADNNTQEWFRIMHIFNDTIYTIEYQGVMIIVSAIFAFLWEKGEDSLDSDGYELPDIK